MNMKLLILLSVVFGYVRGCAESITKVGGSKAPNIVCSGEIVFQDEFETFDFSTWEHETTLAGGGNWEFQWYTNNRSNSYVSDGVLNIVPTYTADDIGESALYSSGVNLWGGTPVETCTNNAFYGCERTGTYTNIVNPIKSARIRTLDSFHFKYGRVEVRAKMPIGDWLWPAIWMLPRYNAYGGWPASGEIDISEVRGNPSLIQSGDQIGVQQTASTLHWGPAYAANRYSLTHWTQNNVEGYNADFHVYGVIWTNDSISFTVDGIVIGSVSPSTNFWEYGSLENTGYSNPWGTHAKMTPFNDHFFIILNLAVGGTNFFPDDATNGNGEKPWSNESGTAATDFWKAKDTWSKTWGSGTNKALQVDYVRVYAI